MIRLTVSAAPMLRVRNIVTGFGLWLVLAAILGARNADAADAENGKWIAQARCAGCHFIIAGHRDSQIAEPFAIIAAKYGFNTQLMVDAILDQHPRMEITVNREDADDIAAYLTTMRATTLDGSNR